MVMENRSVPVLSSASAHGRKRREAGGQMAASILRIPGERGSAASALASLPVARHSFLVNVANINTNSMKRATSMLSVFVDLFRAFLVLVSADMGRSLGGKVELVAPDLQAKHRLYVFTRRLDISLMRGVALEFHSMRQPAGNFGPDRLGQQFDEFIWRAVLDGPLRHGNHRPDVESGWLQASIGRTFSRPVDAHDSLEEVQVGNFLRAIRLPVQRQDLLECANNLSFAFRWDKRQD